MFVCKARVITFLGLLPSQRLRRSRLHSVLLAAFLLLLAQRYGSRWAILRHRHQYHAPGRPATPCTGVAEQPLPCACRVGTNRTRAATARCIVRARSRRGRTSGMCCHCSPKKSARDKWHTRGLDVSYRLLATSCLRQMRNQKRTATSK